VQNTENQLLRYRLRIAIFYQQTIFIEYCVGYLLPYKTKNKNKYKIWNKKKNKNKHKNKTYFSVVNRNQIISELYMSKDINDAIGKMQPYELQDDLRQEVFLVLCEMDEERLFQMFNDGYLKYFIVRTILNMAKSDRSNFSRTFRKVYSEVQDNCQVEEYDDSLNEKLYRAMDVLHWYEKEIFRVYSETGNLLQVSRDTKIPYRSLLKTIKKVKTLLKYKIRNYAHD